MSRVRDIRVLAEAIDRGYKELRTKRLNAERDLRLLECDIEQAVEQKDRGMVAVLQGSWGRKSAYLQGIKDAEELLNG